MKALAKILDLVMLGVSLWLMYETVQSMVPEDARKTRRLAQQQKYIKSCRELAEFFGREALKAEKRYYDLVQS